ncbi:molybdopterin molybdotransferase MoeA [Pseudoalteromonas haloplanktis]|uniref:Molybdopterin molybdenumtransferase n=1 Tax=Pseudoalteromonas haloplanktis TaxID=228 RepID=A0ABU1B8M6_PSEHA|nr:gephyrin-like molybdotransferase Glp [Pseudoalteromonas haloplanktis]MDQ9090151.1 molybdopterin molybdotransferase MoeA [Pseudoalteromonas haloplanktis]
MDCGCDAVKTPLLAFDDALAKLLATATVVTEQQTLTVQHALGRVLADDVISNFNIPPYANSAMDGYAFKHHDLISFTELDVVTTSLAGHPSEQALTARQCARIMTGAMLPKGADTVIMQEQVHREGERISLQAQIKAGANVRAQGEDIAAGNVVLPKGHVIQARDIGLLCAIGVAQVSVLRQLKVALISTGDELVEPGNPLKTGQIFDSNRQLVMAMLAPLGVEIRDFGIIADKREAIANAITQATDWADVLITSGGVSVGDADYVKEILSELGDINFWKLAIKPGKPFAFGQVGQCAFLGLPGNPVSAAITFDRLGIPFIKLRQGQPIDQEMAIKATALVDFKKRPGRTEFQRGIARQTTDGQWQVESAGLQGSGILSALSRANCHVILPSESEGVVASQQVDIIFYKYL